MVEARSYFGEDAHWHLIEASLPRVEENDARLTAEGQKKGTSSKESAAMSLQEEGRIACGANCDGGNGECEP